MAFTNWHSLFVPVREICVQYTTNARSENRWISRTGTLFQGWIFHRNNELFVKIAIYPENMEFVLITCKFLKVSEHNNIRNLRLKVAENLKCDYLENSFRTVFHCVPVREIRDDMFAVIG